MTDNYEGVKILRKPNPRQTRRMMQRLGMKIDEVSNVRKVVIKTDTKEVTIETPDVAIIEVQGQRTFQVVGGNVTEKELRRKKERVIIPDEDVQLVVTQTGKPINEVKAALTETEGNLAKAIILLQSKD
jgi:nascent polypeptide-associated complex subunit alpha